MDARRLTVARTESEFKAPAESKEDQLPNPVTIVQGFLQPYIDMRVDNGAKAVLKAAVCETLIKKVNTAKTLEDWEVILEELNARITEERPTSLIAATGKSLLARVGLIDNAYIYLILLIGARTLACYQLSRNNVSWHTMLEKKYEKSIELRDKIKEAKKRPIDSSDISTWEKSRKTLLKELSNFYHTDALVDANDLGLFESEISVLTLPKSYRYMPEHLQPDFYKRVYDAILKKHFASRKPGETFEEFEIFLNKNFKNPIESTMGIITTLANTPSSPVVPSPARTAVPLRTSPAHSDGASNGKTWPLDLSAISESKEPVDQSPDGGVKKKEEEEKEAATLRI